MSTSKPLAAVTWSNDQANAKPSLNPIHEKGIFSGFVQRTTHNYLWYNFETGCIGKANCVQFDKGMNDQLSTLILQNRPDLEQVDQSN